MGREDDGMIEADGKAQKMGTKIGSPPLLPKEGRRQFFYVNALAAVAVGALPAPSRSERCMTSEHVPCNAGNVATPELYGPP